MKKKKMRMRSTEVKNEARDMRKDNLNTRRVNLHANRVRRIGTGQVVKLRDNIKKAEMDVPKALLGVFMIKSIRLVLQCPYIVQELDARQIPFNEAHRSAIKELKKTLLRWHQQEYPAVPDDEREFKLIACNPDHLWHVTNYNKPFQNGTVT